MSGNDLKEEIVRFIKVSRSLPVTRSKNGFPGNANREEKFERTAHLQQGVF